LPSIAFNNFVEYCGTKYCLQVVNLIGFFPFKTAGDALSNNSSVSEGIVRADACASTFKPAI
jgi:hypothetical protein